MSDKQRSRQSTVAACIIVALGVVLMFPYPMLGAWVVIFGALSPLLLEQV